MQTGKQTDLLHAFWFGIFPGFQSSWRQRLYSTATKSIKMKYAYALLTQHNNETLLVIITLLILHPLNCAIANCLLPAMPSSTLLSLHCSRLSHTKTSLKADDDIYSLRKSNTTTTTVSSKSHRHLQPFFSPCPPKTINYTFTTATTILIISSPKNIFFSVFSSLVKSNHQNNEIVFSLCCYVAYHVNL